MRTDVPLVLRNADDILASTPLIPPQLALITHRPIPRVTVISRQQSYTRFFPFPKHPATLFARSIELYDRENTGGFGRGVPS